jgi:hypothetical protein
MEEFLLSKIEAYTQEEYLKEINLCKLCNKDTSHLYYPAKRQQITIGSVPWQNFQYNLLSEPIPVGLLKYITHIKLCVYKSVPVNWLENLIRILQGEQVNTVPNLYSLEIEALDYTLSDSFPRAEICVVATEIKTGLFHNTLDSIRGIVQGGSSFLARHLVVIGGGGGGGTGGKKSSSHIDRNFIQFLEDQIPVLGYYIKQPVPYTSQELKGRGDPNNPDKMYLGLNRETRGYFCLWTGKDVPRENKPFTPFVACTYQDIPPNVTFDNVIYISPVWYNGKVDPDQHVQAKREIYNIRDRFLCSGVITWMQRFDKASKYKSDKTHPSHVKTNSKSNQG